jgi:periplasmic divalent cation tolerance protein
MLTMVFSTCGSKKEAERIARDLVKRRLAACVNIVPVNSCYRWKGKLNFEREYLIMAKSRSEVFTKLKTRVLALHSYELPEVVSLKILDGYKPYLNWIGNQVK